MRKKKVPQVRKGPRLTLEQHDSIVGSLHETISDLKEKLAKAMEPNQGPDKELNLSWGLAPPPSAVAQTLSQRGNRYGDFSDNADLSQSLKDLVESSSGWDNVPKLQREAISMIFQKISRVVNGDPGYKDNWHDIQGYAKLVEDRLE